MSIHWSEQDEEEYEQWFEEESTFQPLTTANLSQTIEPVNTEPVKPKSAELEAQQQQITALTGALASAMQMMSTFQATVQAKPLQPIPSFQAPRFNSNSKYFKDVWVYKHVYDPNSMSYEDWRVLFKNELCGLREEAVYWIQISGEAKLNTMSAQMGASWYQRSQQKNKRV
jgi:hypothetical protein